jgi:hypothetical protein
MGDGADLVHTKYVLNIELSKYVFRFELAQTVQKLQAYICTK